MPTGRLVWDTTGERFYETGVDHCVLYPYDNTSKSYTNGVAWNGITAINLSPSGADETALWADNIKYLSLRAAEEFGFTIEAYHCPDEFLILDGTAELTTGVVIGQQSRGVFGLCYRSILGNDTKMNEYGNKLHLIYGATVSPTERNYATVNDSPEVDPLSWEATTNPVAVTGHKPTAHVEIDLTKIDSAKLDDLFDTLYGSDTLVPSLPLPDQIITILK